MDKFDALIKQKQDKIEDCICDIICEEFCPCGRGLTMTCIECIKRALEIMIKV